MFIYAAFNSAPQSPGDRLRRLCSARSGFPDFLLRFEDGSLSLSTPTFISRSATSKLTLTEGLICDEISGRSESSIQQVAIDRQVLILENIEDDLDIAACCFFVFFYS